MSNNSVITPEQLDLSKLTFSKTFKNENNGKMVFVNRKDGERSSRIFVATDKVWLPKGLSRIRKADATDSKNDSYVVDIALNEDDILFEKMSQLDDLVRKEIKNNCQEWIGKKTVSDDVVDDRYKAMVNVYAPEGKDKVYNSMQLKVERERDGSDFTGNFLGNKTARVPLKFFDGTDANHPEVHVDESNYERMVPKGSQARCLMELVYIYCGAKVSVKWRLVQMELHTKKQEAVTDYAFGSGSQQPQVQEQVEQVDEDEQDLDDLPEDLDEEEEQAEQVEEEEEEEVVEEEEPVVVKVQAPKKTVTKKRAVQK
jgi:hypothetical protein